MPQIQEKPELNINAKSVAKYALLPGILPRLQRLAAHLSQFMFMFTQIFGSVGLIDRNHPCLKPENIGMYRFRDIIGLAASNVVFDRKHLPQTVMFFAVVLSIVLSVAIFLALIASVLTHVPAAQAQLFGTPNQFGYTESGDWALNFLYRIFGDTGMFPTPADGNMGNAWFTGILVTMLKYYSMAMLVVAAFMILYLLVVTLTESAKSGQPFGSRFDGIWAPVRLALAIGLLMPVMSSGYNGAQMITFQAAIWGSNLATNAWYGGLKTMDNGKYFDTMMGDPGYRFVRDVFLVNLCIAGLQTKGTHDKWEIDDVLYTRSESDGVYTYTFGPEDAPDFCGQVSFLVKPKAKKPKGINGTSWPEKVAANYGAIAMRFLPINNLNDKEGVVAPRGDMYAATQFAAKEILGDGQAPSKDNYFFKKINDVYNYKTVKGWMKTYWDKMGVSSYYCDGSRYAGGSGNAPPDIPDSCTGPVVRGNFFETSNYTDSINEYNNWIKKSMTQDAQFGWTTAGVFYLRITSAFASISEVVNNAPTVIKLPANFTKAFATVDNPSANTTNVSEQCTSGSKLVTWLLSDMNIYDFCAKFEISQKLNYFLRSGSDWFLQTVKKHPSTYALMETETFDRALEISEPETSVNMSKTSVISRSVTSTFHHGLAHIDSDDLNPLATIIYWGNTMIMAAFVAFAIGLAGSGAWADIGMSLGTTLLIPGFVLAFWVPTIPFMQFFFAVVEWMVSVLEAIIGMPLWALSLITLQGDGLGQLGMNGIKRLFEIMLRPTIIILSLVVSVIIFSAGVSFFNSAIDLYVDAKRSGSGQSNVGQFATDLVSFFGMTFLYVFAIYSLATSCFKLIEHIPDRFGRWMGLEGGFGGQLKTGLNSLDKLIIGGAAIKTMGDIGSAYNRNKNK